LYRPGHPAPVAASPVGMAFDHPLIGWVKAGQLIMRLQDYSVTRADFGLPVRRP
jgi:hypothetical protein